MGLAQELIRALSTLLEALRGLFPSPAEEPPAEENQPSVDEDHIDSAPQLGTRRVSDAGIELIEHFEGVRLEAYHDPVGYPTQGIGRLLSRVKWEDLSKYPPISHHTATVWLVEDLEKVCKGLSRLFPVPLNDNEFAALASFAFNLGLGALEASTLRKMLLRGDRQGAADQFLRWDNAGGRKMRGLTLRRRAESALFLRPTGT